MQKKVEKPYLTTICRLKPKTHEEFEALRHMTHASKDVYNMGLYTCRQHYFETHKFLPYEKVYAQVKAKYPDYKNLHSQAAQQTLKKVHQDMISFFEGKKEAQGERKVRIPNYKDKDGFFNTYLSKDCFKIQNQQIRISLSKSCQKATGLKFLYFALPEHLQNQVIKQIEILPRFAGQWFSMAISYVDQTKYEQVSEGIGKYLGIDLGVGNLITLIDTVHSQPIIINGREIKSINQWYNKSIARVKSELEKVHGQSSSERLRNIITKRNDRIKDRLHKIALGIVSYCVANGIEEVVVGKNEGWKQAVKMGKRNNQNFVQIPYSKLIQYLGYRCKQHGIKLTEQEESHTSKCDALGLEEVGHQKSYMGKRIKRGLFRSATGVLINADVNGAINILRKSKGHELDEWVKSLACSGCVFQPRKLRSAGSGSLVLSVA